MATAAPLSPTSEIAQLRTQLAELEAEKDTVIAEKVAVIAEKETVINAKDVEISDTQKALDAASTEAIEANEASAAKDVLIAARGASIVSLTDDKNRLASEISEKIIIIDDITTERDVYKNTVNGAGNPTGPRHVIGKPETFSKMSRNLDMRDWLSSMSNYLTLSKSAPADHVAIASSYLSGEALRYFTNKLGGARRAPPRRLSHRFGMTC